MAAPSARILSCIVLRTGSTVFSFMHMCWCHMQIIGDTGGMDAVDARVHFAQAVLGSDCGFTRETAMDPAAFSWFLRDMYPGYCKRLEVRRRQGCEWSVSLGI